MRVRLAHPAPLRSRLGCFVFGVFSDLLSRRD
jgi:hypothetical protein